MAEPITEAELGRYDLDAANQWTRYTRLIAEVRRLRARVEELEADAG